jgi:STE24 endopeptidase
MERLILGVFVGAFLLQYAVETALLMVNLRHVRRSGGVPAPLAGSVDEATAERSRAYTLANGGFALAHGLVGAALTLAVLLSGVLPALDAALAARGLGGAHRFVAFLAVLGVAGAAVALPFAAWRTFVLEARFGFNRTTPALFLLDLLRGLAIAAALLLPACALALWLLERAGPAWWLWAWAAWAALVMLLGWAWPRLIAPLFNRFHELEPGELREAVESLARRCGFEPRGVRVMDGSRRSTHGNAYFTGIGRSKRIVLFDTLLENLAVAEVQAVLAHELGHFRLRHVAWGIVRSLGAAGAGFALLGWLAQQAWFQPALGVPAGGPHTLLLLFALAAPAFLLPAGPAAAWLSRRHEFAADAFAAAHADAAKLASALVKLHRDNAATLTPDPLYTAFHASHPPVLARIARLGALQPA